MARDAALTFPVDNINIFFGNAYIYIMRVALHMLTFK
jgi:hypothetical protein